MSNMDSLSNIEKWRMKKSLGMNHIYSNVAECMVDDDDDDLPLPPPPPLESLSYLADSHKPFPDPPFELLQSNNNNNNNYPLTANNINNNNFIANDTKKSYPYYPQPQSSTLVSTRDINYEPITAHSSARITPSHLPAPYSASNGKNVANGKPGVVYGVPATVVHSTTSSRLPKTRSKEAEVDHLTDLLVLSLDNSSDPEFMGMCYSCGKKITGFGNACNYMDKIYHVQCLTCVICRKQLSGTPFYSVEGRPHCERDYLNSLEKCSVCQKPIMDRLLKATGKPYHPSCFRCVVCAKSLDSIPFTVDSNNQVYCIDDFHKTFAPRCCVCKLPITPTPGQAEAVRIVALDKSFHVGCYRCEDCDLLLTSESEGRGCFPLDGHILCRLCNGNRVQKICMAP